MNDREYLLMRQVEDTHWWYSVLHRSVADELRSRLDSRSARILDAGCGTGGMMAVLRSRNPSWQLTGLDSSPTALALTGQRGFEDLAAGSVDDLPFPASTFDAVISLDVLYFDGVDDARAIAEFRRVLRAGGVLVLNLPAFPALRGSHDDAVSGVRRYHPRQVRRMLAAAGFTELRSHCWNLWLSIPILCWRQVSRWIGRTRKNQAPASDLFPCPAPLNSVLTTVCRADMALCRALRAGFGTSVMAVARKQTAHLVLRP